MNDEDAGLSDYSKSYKYLDPKGLDNNLKSVSKPVEAYRLQLDLALLRRHLKGPRVLDFPIGTGRIYPHLMNEAFELYGFDIAPAYVDRARAAYPHAAPRFQVNSFESAGASVTFNSIYSMRVLNNLKDRTRAVETVAGLLASGGRWMFTIPQDVWASDTRFGLALENHKFKAVTLHAYDAYVGYPSMPFVLRGFYSGILLRAVRWGLLPHWIFRSVDRVFGGRYGAFFVVVERT